MIADDTPLIPALVAERVVCEELPAERNPRPMIRYLCARAERHYANLPQFRKMLRGGKSLEMLEAFMTHWAKSVIKSKTK